MAEHVALINASGDLRRACDLADAATVKRTAATLRDLLDPHADAEEVGLFAVLAEDEEFTEQVHALCGEHVRLHDLLDEVAAGAYTLYPALDKLLRAHIDREENGLFPAAAIAIPDWQRVDTLTPEQGSARA